MITVAPTCWALIPVKAAGEGKTRLAGMLDPQQRERLVSAMLDRVIDAATRCETIARVCLVSGCDHGLGERVTLIADHGGGLNPALAGALRHIAEAAPSRVIIVAADLPQLDPADLAMLANVPDDTVAIAPDRHGTGTNALSLPQAAFRDFKPQFGQHSHAAHRAQAMRLGYNVETMLAAGLEKDVDVPDDLTDAKGCLQEVP